MSSEAQRKELGIFIRWHREHTRPSESSPSDHRRRVRGLRRSEVADSVGISEQWYVLLEQGRAEYVSSQVLLRLANAFSFDATKIEHMFRLAGKPPPPRPPSASASVPEILRRYLEAQAPCPAYVFDTRWDVLAWNQSAPLILHDLSTLPDDERNLVWTLFTQDEIRHRLQDWDTHARSLLSHFRLDYGRRPDDPRLGRLIARLLDASEDFRLWWPEREVADQSVLRFTFSHPTGVKLVFDRVTFTFTENPELRLLVFLAVPGTGTFGRLKRLAGR